MKNRIALLLCLVRAAGLITFYTTMLPLLSDLWMLSNGINKRNRWQSKDESFITNNSVLNALLCWFFYLLFTFIQLIVIPYFFYVIIMAIAKDPSSLFNQLKSMYRMHLNMIVGKMLFHVVYYDSPLEGQEIKARQPSIFELLNFDEAIGCPICL